MNKVWPFAFSFLLFASVASMSPFIVLYCRGLGFTGAQIGLLTGITPLITLFSVPLWTGLADMTTSAHYEPDSPCWDGNGAFIPPA